MTLIDHRILIVAPPEAIWELVGNLSAMPRWHVNCSQASVLNTRQSGPGTRCRLSITNGPDIVFEIVSWVENFGYEYRVVDGPYRTSLGRIRLRVLPQGTAVHWTFEYELGGLAAGVRDALFTRQRLSDEIEQSLKRLKKVVEAAGISMSDELAERVAMRPAPTAEERAALAETVIRTQPSLKAAPAPQEPLPAPAAPTVIDEGDLPPPPIPTAPTVIDEGDLPPLPILEEPPLDVEDTRPARAITAPEFAAPADVLPTSPAAGLAEAEPVAAVEPRLTDEALPTPDSTAPDTTPDMVPTEPAVEIVSPSSPGVEAPPETIAETVPEMPAVSAPEPEPPSTAPETTTTPAVEDRPSLLFGGEIKPLGPSIWDVFGIKPPSQAEAEAGAEPVGKESTGTTTALPAESTTSEGRSDRLHSRPATTPEGLRRTLNRRRLARIGQLPSQPAPPKKKKRTSRRRSSS
ncbi:MAG: hypothetical protein HPY64_15465 [Anaerolineae bacterium]|nr:hypothetical protein [Anaerolineae bacterium]